jgi:hypothetical protein
LNTVSHKDIKMSLIKLTKPQNQFLEEHLRGTGRTLSARQARAAYGIQNLRARMTELRHAGLRVTTDINSQGRTVYAISSRDVTGSRAARFA